MLFMNLLDFCESLYNILTPPNLPSVDRRGTGLALVTTAGYLYIFPQRLVKFKNMIYNYKGELKWKKLKI